MVANPIPAGESTATDKRMLGKHDPKKSELFSGAGVYRFKSTHRRPTMKTRNRLIGTAAAVIIICLIYSSAWAGAKQQHRCEGVAIGVGAAIAVGTLIHHRDAYHQPPVPVRYAHGYRGHHRHGLRHYGYGHPRYRSHDRYLKYHHRGHGHYRWHRGWGHYGYGHGYKKHDRHWRSPKYFHAPHKGKYGERPKHGRKYRIY
jgi:hypothetical protein